MKSSLFFVLLWVWGINPTPAQTVAEITLEGHLQNDSVDVYLFDDYVNRNLLLIAQQPVINNRFSIKLDDARVMDNSYVYLSMDQKTLMVLAQPRQTTEIHLKVDSQQIVKTHSSAPFYTVLDSFFADMDRFFERENGRFNLDKPGALERLDRFRPFFMKKYDTSRYYAGLMYSNFLVYENNLIESQAKGKRKKAYIEEMKAWLEQQPLLLGSWGYVDCVNRVLYKLIGQQRKPKVPFKTYANPKALKAFVFGQRIFNNDTLEDYARFYKLRKLARSNDRETIHYYLDSLHTTCSHPNLKTVIAHFLGDQQQEYKLSQDLKAPAFVLPDQFGQQHRLTDFEGKYVLLDFWATWCKPCVKSMKKFPALYEKYRDQLEIVSISVDSRPELMQQFIAQTGYPWVFLYNGKDPLVQELYNVNGYPTYVLLDPQGYIALPKLKSLDELEQLLKP